MQWVRIHLPMQGTPVWSLVGEDSTYCRAAKPIATTIEPAHLDPVRRNKRSPGTTIKNSPHLLQLQKVCPKKKKKRLEYKKGRVHLLWVETVTSRGTWHRIYLLMGWGAWCHTVRQGKSLSHQSFGWPASPTLSCLQLEGEIRFANTYTEHLS